MKYNNKKVMIIILQFTSQHTRLCSMQHERFSGKVLLGKWDNIVSLKTSRNFEDKAEQIFQGIRLRV